MNAPFVKSKDQAETLGGEVKAKPRERPRLAAAINYFGFFVIVALFLVGVLVAQYLSLHFADVAG
jgi:hypothetical protein